MDKQNRLDRLHTVFMMTAASGNRECNDVSVQEILADDYCFSIRQAARLLSLTYDRHLAAVELSITQYSLLRRLQDAESMTMQELAHAMVTSRTTLVRAIQPLKRAKWVTGVTVKGGHGSLRLSLTDAGVEKVATARQYWLAAQEAFELKFGEPRAEALRRALFSMTRD